MSVVYLALGSNVGDRLRHLRSAKKALAQSVEITAVSPVYETEPIGTTEPDRFLNAVLKIRTGLSPQELLPLCIDIERQNGRIRTERNAPRTLDIDILLYDELVLDQSDLKVPHPRMHERAFVLAPLADLAPDLRHPTRSATISELLRQCDSQQVVRTDHSL